MLLGISASACTHDRIVFIFCTLLLQTAKLLPLVLAVSVFVQKQLKTLYKYYTNPPCHGLCVFLERGEWSNVNGQSQIRHRAKKSNLNLIIQKYCTHIRTNKETGTLYSYTLCTTQTGHDPLQDKPT